MFSTQKLQRQHQSKNIGEKSRLVRSKNRSLVKLPRDYPHHEKFGRAARAIGTLHLPKNFRICPKPDRRARRAAGKNLKNP